MRKWVSAVALAAAASSASAQAADSVWGFFDGANGASGAGVGNADGTQLLLKCDKPGKDEVYATVVSKDPLVGASNTRFQMRPVDIRFDQDAPMEDRWRFYEQSAVAIDQKSERAFERFVGKLIDADTLRVRMNPERGRWVEINFTVTGAKEAIAHVLEKCQDTMPAAA
jgi:hypothetical protein